MSRQALVELKDVYVSGVDTIVRAQGVKQFLLGRKPLPRDVRIPILNGVSLTLKPGDRLGVVGYNGSGKSSLLKVIAGIYPPQSGELTVRGSLAPLIEMGVGFDPELTGRENIKVGLVYTGRLQDYSAKLEEDIIAFTGLGERIDRPFKVYSLGMRARLCFAVSVFQNPDILLLDEAFAAGDEEFINKARQKMSEKFSAAQIAVLVSHTSELVHMFCNRCIWMHQGKIIADGEPRDIVEQYEKRELAYA